MASEPGDVEVEWSCRERGEDVCRQNVGGEDRRDTYQIVLLRNITLDPTTV